MEHRVSRREYADRRLLRTVRERKAPLVSLSVTLEPHLSYTSDLIAAIRDDAADVKVLVGERAFLTDPMLYDAVGANATAPDALTAADMVDTLIGSGNTA